mmetsp:Transcript_8462/g.20902  ORF Transcript_8462/g.20902 Transcript_8462/m.20902 type:complete len:565 (-) Transcript_8462:714-2408(-)
MPAKSCAAGEKVRRSHERALSIADELEELLTLSGSKDGHEKKETSDVDGNGNPDLSKERRPRSRSKKVKHTRRGNPTSSSSSAPDESRTFEEDSKSIRSKKVAKNGTHQLTESIEQESKGGSRARSTPRKERRKIRYRKNDVNETGNDLVREEKSVRSKLSTGSTLSRRSQPSLRRSKSDDNLSTQNPRLKGPDEIEKHSTRSTQSRYRNRKITYKKHDAIESPKERDRDARSTRSRNRVRSKQSSSDESSLKSSTSKGRAKRLVRNKQRDRSHTASEDDDSVEVSLDDEEEIQVGLNDEVFEVGLNDEGIGRARGARRRTPRENSTSIERTRRLPSRRSTSFHETSGVIKPGCRRPPRKSASAITSGMVLGDPSRRAPPGRSKSNDLASDFSRKPPARNQSNDFTDFLRLKGLEPRPDLKTGAHSFNSFAGEDEDGNPFEITYQAKRKPSHEFDDTWDPFSADCSDDDVIEHEDQLPTGRRGKMTATKSGGLLMASSRDTISRGKLTKPKKVETKTVEEEKPSEDGGKTERAKQRRADYKKSIAAATMAGRRTSLAPRSSKIP